MTEMEEEKTVGPACTLDGPDAYTGGQEEGPGGEPLGEAEGKKKEKRPRLTPDSILFLLPIIFAVGYIPLITVGHKYHSAYSNFGWYIQDPIEADLFLWGKAIAVILTASVMLVLLIIRKVRFPEEGHFHRRMVCPLLYLLLVLLSGFLSPFPGIALTLSAQERFESAFVVAGYALMALYCMTVLYRKEQLLRIVKWATPGSFLLTLIGFFQGLGLDFFQTYVGKFFLSWHPSWIKDTHISPDDSEGLTYMTMGNVDYTVEYYCLLIPVLILMVLLVKDLAGKLFYLVFTGMALFTLYQTRTVAGRLVILFGLFAFLIIFLFQGKHGKVRGALLFFLLAGIGAALLLIPSSRKEIASLVEWKESSSSSGKVRSIYTREDGVEFDLRNGRSFLISWGDDPDREFKPLIVDQDGKKLDYDLDKEGKTYFYKVKNGKAYADPLITTFKTDVKGYSEDQIDMVSLNVDKIPWIFTKLGGQYFFETVGGYLVQITKEVPNAHVFPGGFLNWRGDIWNYALAVLGKYNVLGIGSGCFAIATPQNTDYVWLSYYTENQSAIMSVKGHSLYLTNWIENGLPALISYLIMAVWYSVESVLLYTRSFFRKNRLGWAGLAVFLGNLVYFVIVLANDSWLGVAQISWCMIGIGIALNGMAKKELNGTQDERSNSL